MADVVWTEQALADLDAIGAFHERTSPAYARSTVQRLYDSVEVLEMYPRFGRKVAEIDHEAVRELIVGGYRVVYQLIRGRVEIVVVLHGRQDVRRRFRERSSEE